MTLYIKLGDRLVNPIASLASTPAKTLSGQWFTGGTSTSTKPHFLIEQPGAASTNWSTAGTGFGVNAASGFSGRIVDLQVNGTSCFVVTGANRTVVAGSTVFTDRHLTNNRQVQLTVTQASGTTGVAIATQETSATDAVGARLSLQRFISSSTAVSLDDQLGSVSFLGSVGGGSTAARQGALVSALVDGTVSSSALPGRIVFSTSPANGVTPIENWRLTNEGVVAYSQNSAVAVNSTATLTVANLKNKIISSTSAAATDMTLPSGTLTEAGFNGVYTGLTFEWSVINTGPNLVRILSPGSDHTIVGSGNVATGTTGRFATRRSASNTFITYRLA